MDVAIVTDAATALTLAISHKMVAPGYRDSTIR